MTKENVLFSIIGLLFGFIVGFMFTNSINQRGVGASLAGGGAAQSNQLPMNAVKDQQAMQTALQEAVKKAREAPGDFDAQMKAAEINYQLQRFDEASEYLLRANELRPDDDRVVVLLGNANYDAGRYSVAERWYTAALVKNPDDINVRTDLGLTFLLREPPDIDRAIAEFRGSLERDPRHEATLQNLVVALTRKGDIKGAEETLAKLQEVNPGNQMLAKLRASIEERRNAPASSPSPANSNTRK